MSIPVSVLSRPENRLLLLCACRFQAPASKTEFLALLRQPLDWNYLLPRLQSHGLLALLCHHLQGKEALLPPRPLEMVRFEFSQGLQRRLKMLAELQQVVGFLTAQGVRVLAYKGPILAHLAYGSVALRPFSDLDLLVAPADKARVVTLLKSQGYQPDSEDVLPAHLEAKRQLRDYEITLRPTPALDTPALDTPALDVPALDTPAVGALDVHWAVAPPYDAFPLEFEALWERRVASALLPSVSTFGREDLLLCLCAHGLKHRWRRLEWIGCLLGILHNADAEPLQWQRIENSAAALHCGRALRLGVGLALDLAALDEANSQALRRAIPEPLRRAVGRDRVARQLGQQIWEGLFDLEHNGQEEAFITVPALLFAIRAREGWKVRRAYFSAILRAFLVPDPEDVSPDSRGSRAVYFVRLQRLILRRLHRLLVLRRF